MHTKRVKEINDNSPLKTDEKDPRVIADIIRWGHALSIVIPEGDAAYLRRLNNSRERHVRERTALVNQLQQTGCLRPLSWMRSTLSTFKRSRERWISSLASKKG